MLALRNQVRHALLSVKLNMANWGDSSLGGAHIN